MRQKQFLSLLHVQCKLCTYHASRLTLSPNRSKQAFHLTHVTLEVHEVWPPRFPCPWYIWGKPRTYLTPRLTLSSNGLKPGSTRPMSPWSSIGCSKNNFEPIACSVQTVHQSCVEIKIISKRPEASFHLTHVTYESHWVGAK
jgi:hypothetical protein